MIKKVSLIVALCTVVLATISTAHATKYLCTGDRGHGDLRGLGASALIDTEEFTVSLWYDGSWSAPMDVIDDIRSTGAKTPHYILKDPICNCLTIKLKYKIYNDLSYRAKSRRGKVYGECEIKE